MDKKPERTLLGFDYGTKRIGIAVGQELTSSASPLATVYSSKARPDWDAISKVMDNWRPQALVVGIPLGMDGREHELTRAARRFGRQLKERYNIPVYTVDERLTSVEAEHQLAAGHSGTTGKRPVDEIAAQIILQAWFDQNANIH